MRDFFARSGGGADFAHQVAYWTVNVPKNILVNGYVRIWVSGQLDLKQTNVTWQNPTTPIAARLEYYMFGMTGGKIIANGNTQVWCHVYAPQYDVPLGGNGNFTGWAIGKTLTFQVTVGERPSP